MTSEKSEVKVKMDFSASFLSLRWELKHWRGVNSKWSISDTSPQFLMILHQFKNDLPWLIPNNSTADAIFKQRFCWIAVMMEEK